MPQPPYILKEITIAAAQTIPKTGDIKKNAESHLDMIKKVADLDVDLIVFPELSLTGYDLGLSANSSISFSHPVLQILLSASVKYNMCIVAGAPVQIEQNLYIGAYIMKPDQTIRLYLKHHLHPGEEKVYHAGFFNPDLYIRDDKVSIAVCADIGYPDHAGSAAGSGSSIYATSVFISPKGYSKDSSILKGYAKKHHMAVLMANYGGPTGGNESAGKSALWSEKGDLIAGMDGTGEGIVLATRTRGKWTGNILQ